MATTGAISRPRERGTSGTNVENRRGGKVAVLQGYPFTLVRRLFLAFFVLLGSALLGLLILEQPTDLTHAVAHLAAVAVAIVASMYVAELFALTERPMPQLKIESVFSSIAVSCLVLGLGYLILPPTTYAPPLSLLCAAPALSALAVYVRRKWAETQAWEDDVVPAAIYSNNRRGATEAFAAIVSIPGVRVDRVLLPPQERDRAPIGGVEVRGADAGMVALRQEGIRMLFVEDPTDESLQTVLAPAAGAGLMVESAQDVAARLQGKVNLSVPDHLALLTRITCHSGPDATQRTLDLVLGSALFLLTLPLWPLIAVAIWLESGRPVLYVQERVGLWGRTFRMLKFRTMHPDAEKGTGPRWASESDPRITRVGRVLRHLRLDELPQLLNVVRGEMSLVGPRPERPYFVQRLSTTYPLYATRHRVRPGVTGWAQIRYAYGSTDEDAREKLAYDLFYLLHRSVTFYFTVLLETAKVVLFRRGSR